MGKIISYEEALALPRVWDDLDIANMPIYAEANEDGACKIVQSLNCSPPAIEIFIEDNTLGDAYAGFLVCIHKDIIYVYVATNSDGDIRDCSEVCSLQPDATLSEVKAKASLEINICPVCGKSVPFTNQSGFSFAGRCCKDCLPEMKKKYEYPGWYN